VPTPKKRRVRKEVLGDISTNAPRLRPAVNKQLPKKAATKRKLATVSLADIALKKRVHLPRLSLSTDIHFSPSAEEHEEFRLTVVDIGKKPKFEIFRDTENSPGQ
jgi:hypothetical protein